MIKNLKLFTVLFLALTIQSCSNNDDDDYVIGDDDDDDDVGGGDGDDDDEHEYALNNNNNTLNNTQAPTHPKATYNQSSAQQYLHLRSAPRSYAAGLF